jgi:SanA protein
MLAGLLRIVLLAALLAAVIALPRAWVVSRFTPRIYSLESLPEARRQAAIVFGAGLRWDGRPSTVLADRVATAVQLYQRGLVEQLIMSGSQHQSGYDEPAAMEAMARQLGVPEHAIVQDGAGTRTIETCRQAIQAFELQSAYLVSQQYHLPRALATCAGLGLQADGVAADLRRYRAERYWRLRELPATLIALWESYVFSPSLRSPAGRVPS